MWIVILCTIGIYARVGAVISKWRKHLLQLGRDNALLCGDTEIPVGSIMKTSEVVVRTSDDKRGSSRTKTNGRPFSGYIRQKASFVHRPRQSSGTQKRFMVHRSGGIDPNKAAIKYCKCALLFFLALVVTWVPSTFNRIYTILRPGDVIFGLNIAAAIVLPLQGFWNTVIYTATSTYAVKCLWSDLSKHIRACYPGKALSLDEHGKKSGDGVKTLREWA